MILCPELVEGHFMRMSFDPCSRLWQCGAKQNKRREQEGEW